MKRLLISVCVALAFPGMALSQTAAPAAKPAAAKKTPAAKPKIVLMTRDELRACFKSQAENATESKAIDVEKDAFQQERSALVADKEAMQKQLATLEGRAKTIVAEGAALKEEAKEFANPVPKDKLKEAEARRAAFNERVDAHQAKINAFNTEKNQFNAGKDQLDLRIAANNTRGRALQERGDKYNNSVDDWKLQCGDKPYNEADEVAVKKELGLK